MTAGPISAGPVPAGPVPAGPVPAGPVPAIWVLNGPNLGRLGTRETDIYGLGSYADLVALCQREAAGIGATVDVRQTDDEGDLLRWLHAAADAGAPVVLNAAAWTHYSVAVRDACAMLTAPLVEVHISNVHKREPFRHTSLISAVATGVIAGLGFEGYALAIRFLAGKPGPAGARASSAGAPGAPGSGASNRDAASSG
jgi:3-dehydroquinate dehydratase II